MIAMNLDRVLKSLLSSPASAGLAGAVAGGLLTSKGGRKLGKQALQVGGMAAIAGIAYAAWQRHQRGAAGAAGTIDAAPSARRLRDAGFLPAGSSERASGELDLALFRAMVAAARSDGRLDVAERRALFDHIAKLEIEEAERAELFEEIERPVTLDDVVAAATSRERAVELYAASRLAIEPDSPSERGYLALLAARLDLDDALVASIERETAGDAAPASVAEGRSG
jgi:uncharacterized membrane protein YebE (DUF533 family)